MPKIKYYDDVIVMKKPVKKRILTIVSFFCIVVAFSSCIVVSKYLSSALTVGNVFNGFIYGKNEIKVKEKKYFAVCLGIYSDYKEAEGVAIGSTLQGASGYVWSESSEHYVIGSIYSLEDDALKVVDNLKDSKYSVSIKNINIPSINIVFENYDSKAVRKVEKAINFIDYLYSILYSYSIDFDKSTINNLAISTYVSDKRGECKVLISEMQNLLKTHNDNLQKIQNSLILVDQLLNELIIKTIDNSSTGYVLKNAIVSVVKIRYDLILQFK